MAEPGGSETPSNSRRNFLKKAALAGGLVAAGRGLDVLSAAAGDETPTPNAVATEKANLQATITAQKKALADQAELDKLKAEATALVTTPKPTDIPKPTNTPKPPDSTPTPSPTLTPNAQATAAVQATIAENSAKYRGQLQATATADAKATETKVAALTPSATLTKEPPTQTSTPTVTPTATPGRVESAYTNVRDSSLDTKVSVAAGAAILGGGALLARGRGLRVPGIGGALGAVIRPVAGAVGGLIGRIPRIGRRGP